MREYESMHLVKGEDLNHHGTLFAARAAAWAVEAGFAAAACEHGNPDEIVLRGLRDMTFARPVKKGAVVRFVSRVVYAGRTSITVQVTAKDVQEEQTAVEGFLTFVTVDSSAGKKKAHRVTLDETSDFLEQAARERALELAGLTV